MVEIGRLTFEAGPLIRNQTRAILSSYEMHDAFFQWKEHKGFLFSHFAVSGKAESIRNLLAELKELFS